MFGTDAQKTLKGRLLAGLVFILALLLTQFAQASHIHADDMPLVAQELSICSSHNHHAHHGHDHNSFDPDEEAPTPCTVCFVATSEEDDGDTTPASSDPQSPLFLEVKGAEGAPSGPATSPQATYRSLKANSSICQTQSVRAPPAQA